MHITAKADYAVRTLVELAAVGGRAPAKAEALAAAQGIPHKFLESVLSDLRRAELVRSRRGPDGGYWLAREASNISVADVMRAVEGPLASVRGQRPEDAQYAGPAEPLTRVWLAVRVNLRAVLESVSLADIVDDDLPDFVRELISEPTAWSRR
ncbi:transcriptional regulator [Rhodococcus sp. 05-2256-B2]|uniref:RrF2 family transcriptional regulator n=1 Tax=unclassified Rhodococcus (in: high G+C Gram-positive bacteria) TaxID=192944 RepID=UPI000B9AE331|nr:MULTISPECIES: Rrf2 family transcriptional regulator [unclassified Rhodococcus (in: high G+C Gram-positive bacteria)]OZD84327.1 transcriptional regulator [Rhodococcus sp. 05-2256-B4]OZD89083.1 transcriptional regulator [Rhodococcus sp. 05-2256-B3]OZD93342.1 transcriptional regulator [Rhodococcus sp. 05-2256-B2]OZE03567.1 transcriptional regulator [Rhodococcus sp. 05-2256-B1]